MDRTEFSRYAERYKDTVYRVALNYLGSAADAEDAVQEVLLRLYTSSRRFADEDHVKHWLVRVTLNLCSNAVRARRHLDAAPLEEQRCAVQFQAPEQLALYQAVMSLPERYRTVLYLSYILADTPDCSVSINVLCGTAGGDFSADAPILTRALLEELADSFDWARLATVNTDSP